MSYLVRVLVISAVMIAHYLVRGLGSLVETFAAALVAVIASHLVVRGLQLGRPRAQVSRVLRAATVIAIGLIIAGAGAAVVLGFGAVRASGPMAYRTVNEVMADPAALVDHEIRLHGYLERGSLHSRIIDQQSSHDFALSERGQRIAAHFTGPVPETFAERAEVIATGRVTRTTGGYLFEATDVIAKCPSTYQTASGPVPASRFR